MLRSGPWVSRSVSRLYGFMDVVCDAVPDTQDLCDDDKILPGINITYDNNSKRHDKEANIYVCPWSDDIIICADLQDKFTEKASDLCGRTLLVKICEEANKNGFQLKVGFEIEFNLSQTNVNSFLQKNRQKAKKLK